MMTAALLTCSPVRVMLPPGSEPGTTSRSGVAGLGAVVIAAELLPARVDVGDQDGGVVAARAAEDALLDRLRAAAHHIVDQPRPAPMGAAAARMAEHPPVGREPMLAERHVSASVDP